MVSLESAIFKPPTDSPTHEGVWVRNIYASKQAEHEWVWKCCTLLPQRDDLKSRTCLQSLLLSITTTVVGSRTRSEPHVHANDPLNTHLTSLSWQVLVFTDGSGWAALVGDESGFHTSSSFSSSNSQKSIVIASFWPIEGSHPHFYNNMCQTENRTGDR